jgi:hypothetical protein
MAKQYDLIFVETGVAAVVLVLNVKGAKTDESA